MTNDQTVTQALEPCPMCGGQAELIDLGDPQDDSYVHCIRRSCGLQQIARYTPAEAIAAWNTRTAHSGEGRSNGAGEGLASIVVKLSAIRTALREAHWALDDSEDMSHQDPPVHAVPLDNVMRLHRALKACERFAAADEAWDGPGPLVTQIIEWLGTSLSTPQGEMERLDAESDRLRAGLENIIGTWERNKTEAGDDWQEGYEDALAECARQARAALAQPEAGGER